MYNTTHQMQLTEARYRMEWFGIKKELINSFLQTEKPLVFYNGIFCPYKQFRNLSEIVDKFSDKIGGIVYAIVLHPQGDIDKCAFLVVRGKSMWWQMERGQRTLFPHMSPSKFKIAVYEFSKKDKTFRYVLKDFEINYNYLNYCH